MNNMQLTPFAIGAGFILLMLLIARVITGKWSPLTLARGDGDSNGQVSASKLQYLVFTFVAVFAYTSITGARLLSGKADFNSTLNVPLNLIILMGLSVTTAITSKAITVSYLQQDRISPDDKSTLLNGRNGKPDLVKAQMLMWMAVAVFIYLAKIVQFVNGGFYSNTDISMPDVDTTLITLMGVSQGAYIGNKLASKDAPEKQQPAENAG